MLGYRKENKHLSHHKKTDNPKLNTKLPTQPENHSKEGTEKNLLNKVLRKMDMRGLVIHEMTLHRWLI